MARAGGPARSADGALGRDHLPDRDWILTVGLIYRGYAVTGSTVASALTMASSFRTAGAARRFVEHVLHGSPQDLGLILAAQAVGGIVGGMAAAASSHRMQAARLLCYGAVAFGLVDLAIFLYPLGYPAVWPAITGMIIVGLPGALTLAGLITLFQHNTEDSYRGRIFGVAGALEGVTVLAGTLGAGFLSRLAGIIPVLAVQGAGYVVAGVVMLLWLRDSAGASLAAAEPVTARPDERAGYGIQPDGRRVHAAAHPGGRVQSG